jgi:hypothetical protein
MPVDCRSALFSALPLLENDRDRTDHHGKTDEVVPLERFSKIEHGEEREYGQGDDFLDSLQLGCRELVGSDAVGGHLKTMFGKGDQPADDNDFEQWSAAIFQMAIPRKGHENVGKG